MVVMQPPFQIEYGYQKRKAVSVMNIADRIQSLRKSKGISQEELADVYYILCIGGCVDL